MDYVQVYMTAWCPDCWKARRVLEREGVAYREIDIEGVAGADAAMRLLNGGTGKVPTIIIGDRVLVEPSDHELAAALDTCEAPRRSEDGCSLSRC